MNSRNRKVFEKDYKDEHHCDDLCKFNKEMIQSERFILGVLLGGSISTIIWITIWIVNLIVPFVN